jgi:manganese transport protein
MNKETKDDEKFIGGTGDERKSLDEINGTIDVPENKGYFRTLMAYTGPGALIAVGYMDPGNWITSIGGGVVVLNLSTRY